jgi:hypothetical protein
VAERFAIDFVQLNAADGLYTGNKTTLASYGYFGAPVHAVAEGSVVGTQDGLPEQVPGQAAPPPPATRRTL